MSAFPASLRLAIQKAVAAAHTPGKRLFVNQRGHLIRDMRSSGLQNRLEKYAAARVMGVAQLMVLGELLRETKSVERFCGPTVEVKQAGAFWQLFRGTTSNPACHTVPALLLFDGHLPTQVANAAEVPPSGRYALQVRLVETFGHCVLMPQFVNAMDEGLDVALGGPALAQAMQHVVGDKKGTAREGIRLFLDRMLEVLPALRELDPDDLAEVIDHVRPQSAAGRISTTRDFESAMERRLDDPNHQYVAALESAMRWGPPASELEKYRKQVTAEVQDAK